MLLGLNPVYARNAWVGERKKIVRPMQQGSILPGRPRVSAKRPEPLAHAAYVAPAIKFGILQPADFNDDSMRDIWLGSPEANATPRWWQAQQERMRLLAAAQGYGLNPGWSEFMISSPGKLMQVAARGLPNVPNDWVNGMQMYDLVQNEHYGLSHIYELVLNTTPRIAYLLNSNTPVATKLVIAHVFGHNDFFTRNRHFANTRPEEILQIIGGHRKEVRELENDLTIPRDPDDPKNPVKEFKHKLHSIESLIDPEAERPPFEDFGVTHYVPPPSDAILPKNVPTLNPDDRYLYSDEAWAKKEEEVRRASLPRKPRFPSKGFERDILGFIARHSTVLAPWQRRMIQMKREQMYYFAPQMRTKIMNEGWASFWHGKLMLEDPETTLDDTMEFQKLNDGVLSPNPRQLNPYWLGHEMWQHLFIKGGLGIPLTDDLPEKYLRHNKFSITAFPEFDQKKGLQAILAVSAQEDDHSFIQKYLTQQLAEKLKLYTFDNKEEEHGEGAIRIRSRQYKEVHTALSNVLKNSGDPILNVVDGNFNDNGELLIEHSYITEEMNIKDTRQVCQTLASLWGRPVHLDTYANNQDGELVAIRYTADPWKKGVGVFKREGKKADLEQRIRFDAKGRIV